MEHKFVLFPSTGVIISTGIRATHSFPLRYHVGKKLVKHKDCGEKAKRGGITRH